MLNGAKDLYAAARLRGLGDRAHLVLSTNKHKSTIDHCGVP